MFTDNHSEAAKAATVEKMARYYHNPQIVEARAKAEAEIVRDEKRIADIEIMTNFVSMLNRMDTEEKDTVIGKILEVQQGQRLTTYASKLFAKLTKANKEYIMSLYY